jgi:hypothetical protein
MSTATTYNITFGLYKDGNTPITEDEFNLFLTEEVVPLLDSFSISDTLGFWNGEPEPCRVLTFISSDYDDGVTVYGIALSYKKRFDQEAVMVNSFTSFPELV